MNLEPPKGLTRCEGAGGVRAALSDSAWEREPGRSVKQLTFTASEQQQQLFNSVTSDFVALKT